MARSAGDKLYDAVLAPAVSRNNYVLFSTTTVKLGYETKTVGFGLFGGVWMLPEFNNLIKDLIKRSSR
jgi:hypothetical protein